MTESTDSGDTTETSLFQRVVGAIIGISILIDYYMPYFWAKLFGFGRPIPGDFKDIHDDLIWESMIIHSVLSGVLGIVFALSLSSISLFIELPEIVTGGLLILGFLIGHQHYFRLRRIFG